MRIKTSHVTVIAILLIVSLIAAPIGVAGASETDAADDSTIELGDENGAVTDDGSVDRSGDDGEPIDASADDEDDENETAANASSEDQNDEAAESVNVSDDGDSGEETTVNASDGDSSDEEMATNASDDDRDDGDTETADDSAAERSDGDESDSENATTDTDADPATFVVSVWDRHPYSPVLDESHTFYLIVSNEGEETGTQNVTLEIDGEERDRTEVTLEGGAETRSSLSWMPSVDDAGERNVTISTADDESSTTVTLSAGTLEGTVTDEEGNPLNATVNLPDQTVTTDADGSFEAVVESGSFVVTADADGYVTAGEYVEVETGETTTTTITLGDDTTAVSGLITDHDGDPIEGATVVVNDIDGEFRAETATASDGEYEVVLEPGDGTYRLTVTADSYDERSLLLYPDTGAKLTENLTLEETSSVINGTVTDATGNPVAHAFVTVGDRQTTTDADGTYELPITSGEYTVAVSADGLKDASEAVSVGPGENATVDVTLDNADGTVAGTVIDADGDPIKDATVTAGDEEVTTDADGSFAVDLPVDYDFTVYTVAVSADGFEDASKDATIAPGKTTAVPIELAEADSSETDADVVVDVTSEDGAVGDTVDVSVDIESATDGTEAVAEYDLELEYDPTTVAFEGVDSPRLSVDDAEAGAVTVSQYHVPRGQSATPVDAFDAEFEIVDDGDTAFEFDADDSSVVENDHPRYSDEFDVAYGEATLETETAQA